MLKFCILTYNLNNKKSALEDLSSYIETLLSDIVIISLQEYFKTISFETKFPFIYQKKLFGLHLIILSKIKLTIDFSVFCLGPFYLGNKGIVIADVKEIDFQIVSLHFKDGIENSKIRIDQFHFLNNLLKKDKIFLAGDFNFRNADEEIFKDFGYKEEEIKFPRTYKYKGTVFDPKRSPAFCDRIIYKNTDNFIIEKYDSLQNFNNSDHKPVFLKIFTFKNKILENNILQLEKCTLSEISSFVYENSLILISVSLLIFAIYKF